MMIEALLEEANAQADARNSEVLDRVFFHLRNVSPISQYRRIGREMYIRHLQEEFAAAQTNFMLGGALMEVYRLRMIAIEDELEDLLGVDGDGFER